jgi:hypothetical protein
LCNPTEFWAVHEVTVKFKARVAFWKYIMKKRKIFGIKLYKLCDRRGCTYDMVAYHGKRANAAEKSLLHMDNYFSLPQLFSDLYGRKMNSCSTIPHNRKGMPANSEPKMLKLKKGDLLCKVK